MWQSLPLNPFKYDSAKQNLDVTKFVTYVSRVCLFLMEFVKNKKRKK